MHDANLANLSKESENLFTFDQTVFYDRWLTVVILM
jgi:hypothetical protein